MGYYREEESAMSEKETRAFVLMEMTRESHGISREKGWYEDKDGQPIERNIPEMLCLIHSEVSEALEDYRCGGERECLLEPPVGVSGCLHSPTSREVELRLAALGWKPVGFASELADILIRLCDLAGHLDVDLARAYDAKTAYNRTRPYRHGGKLA